MTTRSAKCIADGICPGWTPYGEYRVDQGYVAPCGKRITRGDLCGFCDNKRKRRAAERKLIEARRLERERQARDRAALDLLGARMAVLLGSPESAIRSNPAGTALSIVPQVACLIAERLEERA